MSLHLPKHKWGTRGIHTYSKLECIGAGTYGQVYLAKSKDTGELVAIKKIRSLNEVQGLPVTTIREIKVLKCLNHKNIVELKEVVVSGEKDDEDDDGDFTDKDDPLDYCNGSIYLVLEYVEHDLTGLIDRQYNFSDIEIKSIMKQLLGVMEHMHTLDIVHRDIKCSNLLMTKHHVLKVADFGLARSIRGDQLFTNKVITLWYRPPELLLGATSYDASIDMWSIGCVFAELYIGHPLFQGKTELEQISKIFDICGTPTTDLWPHYKYLPLTQKFVPEKPKPRRLREYLYRETSAKKKLLPKGAMELLEALLVLDPEQRLTAVDALASSYFKEKPYIPVLPEDITPKINLPPSHEYQTKKQRREQAKNVLLGASNPNAPSNEQKSSATASKTGRSQSNAAQSTNVNRPVSILKVGGKEKQKKKVDHGKFGNDENGEDKDTIVPAKKKTKIKMENDVNRNT